MAFQSQRGLSQWRTVYNYLQGLEVDGVISDEKLNSLLLDAAPGSIIGAFRRAVKEMETVHQRTFVRVRTVGYRMVHAREHEQIARDYRKRAKRSMTTAHRKAHSADRRMLTPDERRRIDGLEHHLATQTEMLNRLAERHERLDQRVAKGEKVHLEVDDRVSRLEETLRRNGMLDD